MSSEAMSIGELADAAGLTRRAVRFYVQQKLLPAPTGRGRGSHYDHRHLDQLRRVIELQHAGHSLDAIRQVLDGVSVVPQPAPASRGQLYGRSKAAAEPANLRAELWTRLRIGEGIELSFDATRHNPTVEQLLTLRRLIRETFT